MTERSDSIPKSTQPYYVVPPDFRVNKYFIGMERQYKKLDKHLFDDRRADGTAAVLLHGPAGCGKSHIARQFVHSAHKDGERFKGGIFWINARFPQERSKAFWHIAQNVVTRDDPERRKVGEFERKTFVQIVKEWFESRQNWLLVFDGVTVDRDEDYEELSRFVPNSPNSSLIFTSRTKKLESSEPLLSPFAIKVPPLKDDQGLQLLFNLIPIQRPREIDRKAGRALVREVEGLPLALAVISHRISDTREPLEKFTLKAWSGDSKLANIYKGILEDLKANGYIPAYNLINVLCFFGPVMPVEMVHLGLKALKYEHLDVKSIESGNQTKDINITFGILMRHALLERNEPDDKASISSSQSSLEPDRIDMLKIHRPFQQFCADHLFAAGNVAEWLLYAIRLFCQSYREAVYRIKTTPEPCRISDYREYLIHGEKLYDNTLKYDRPPRHPLSNHRRELETTLQAINNEIDLREPNSSQESINQVLFQVSVFDRHSISSSSNESDEPAIATPRLARPDPLHIPAENETAFGFLLAEYPTDSPRSVVVSPDVGPYIINHSPRSRFPQSYDHGHTGSHGMEKTDSEITARPLSAAPVDPTWAVVSKPKRLPIESTRAASIAAVTDYQATGAVSPRTPIAISQGGLSAASTAVESLVGIHKASPPPFRGGGAIKSRSSSGHGSPAMKPTYAGVVAGVKPTMWQTRSTSLAMQMGSSTAEAERGRQRESTVVHAGHIHSPLRSSNGQSPLRSEFVPSAMHGPSTLSHSSERASNDHSLDSSQLEVINDNSPPFTYYRPVVPEHNPQPLAFDTNVSIQRADRPHLLQFTTDASTSPPASPFTTGSFSPHALSTYSPALPPAVLALPTTAPIPFPLQPGYYSQPPSVALSREDSSHSHASTRRSDPRLPPFGHPVPYAASEQALASSPREGYLTGEPPLKSPRHTYARAAAFVPRNLSSSTPDILYGAGEWSPFGNSGMGRGGNGYTSPLPNTEFAPPPYGGPRSSAQDCQFSWRPQSRLAFDYAAPEQERFFNQSQQQQQQLQQLQQQQQPLNEDYQGQQSSFRGQSHLHQNEQYFRQQQLPNQAQSPNQAQAQAQTQLQLQHQQFQFQQNQQYQQYQQLQAQAQVQQQQQQQYHTPAISRPSVGSGPGWNMPGIGIAPFRPPGQITFGEQAPLDIAASRQRLWEMEQRLRERSQAGSIDGMGSDNTDIEGRVRRARAMESGTGVVGMGVFVGDENERMPMAMATERETERETEMPGERMAADASSGMEDLVSGLEMPRVLGPNGRARLPYSYGQAIVFPETGLRPRGYSAPVCESRNVVPGGMNGSGEDEEGDGHGDGHGDGDDVNAGKTPFGLMRGP